MSRTCKGHLPSTLRSFNSVEHSVRGTLARTEGTRGRQWAVGNGGVLPQRAGSGSTGALCGLEGAHDLADRFLRQRARQLSNMGPKGAEIQRRHRASMGHQLHLAIDEDDQWLDLQLCRDFRTEALTQERAEVADGALRVGTRISQSWPTGEEDRQ